MDQVSEVWRLLSASTCAPIRVSAARRPGDLIFSGTPDGVGSVRDPRRYLASGEEIVSTIEHLGTLRNVCK